MGNLIYQEFTNTSTIVTKIPFSIQTLLSAIFTVLSLPLFTYDYVKCQIRSSVF